MRSKCRIENWVEKWVSGKGEYLLTFEQAWLWRDRGVFWKKASRERDLSYKTKGLVARARAPRRQKKMVFSCTCVGIKIFSK